MGVRQETEADAVTGVSLRVAHQRQCNPNSVPSSVSMLERKPPQEQSEREVHAIGTPVPPPVGPPNLGHEGWALEAMEPKISCENVDSHPAT